jgi:hypothetical protein
MSEVATLHWIRHSLWTDGEWYAYRANSRRGSCYGYGFDGGLVNVRLVLDGPIAAVHGEIRNAH